jgi:hypothetical protein
VPLDMIQACRHEGNVMDRCRRRLWSRVQMVIIAIARLLGCTIFHCLVDIGRSREGGWFWGRQYCISHSMLRIRGAIERTLNHPIAQGEGNKFLIPDVLD